MGHPSTVTSPILLTALLGDRARMIARWKAPAATRFEARSGRTVDALVSLAVHYERPTPERVALLRSVIVGGLGLRLRVREAVLPAVIAVLLAALLLLAGASPVAAYIVLALALLTYGWQVSLLHGLRVRRHAATYLSRPELVDLLSVAAMVLAQNATWYGFTTDAAEQQETAS